MKRCLLFVLVFSSSAIAVQPTKERQQELQQLLRHDCGSCHGLTLNGGLGSSLLAEALINKTDEYLVSTIRDGRKGTPMPPWKRFLTDDEIGWLVKTLR